MRLEQLGIAIRRWGLTGFIPAVARHLLRPQAGAFALRAEDVHFDQSSGVETASDAALGGLTIASQHKCDGSQYSATPLRIFSKVMRSLPIEPRAYTFLDCGCGKGRTLLLAASHGFRDIVGVDFSEELCHIADENLRHYKHRTPCTATFEVHHGDAVDLELPDRNCVLYLFHPFGEVVMEQVTQQIVNWLSRTTRDLFIVYVNPQWRRCFDNVTRLELYSGSVWTPEWYLIYRASQRMTPARMAVRRLRRLAIRARRQGVLAAADYLLDALTPTHWTILSLPVEAAGQNSASPPSVDTVRIEQGVEALAQHRQLSCSHDFFLDQEHLYEDCFFATIGEDLIAVLWVTTHSRYVALAEGHLEIQGLYVREEFRGLGIARWLVTEASRRLLATGCRCIFAVVDERNQPSSRTFLACGYHVEDRVWRPLAQLFGTRYHSRTRVLPPCEQESTKLPSH